MTWEIRVMGDGSLFVDAAAPTLAGAARLEFLDGSFVDVDPMATARLISVHACPTDTGQWLARAALGDQVATAFAAEQIPSRCVFDALDSTGELGPLAKAAQIAHLARHDTASRRPVWHAELLAVLAPIATIGSFAITDLPICIDEEATGQAVRAAATGRELAEEGRIEVANMLAQVESCVFVGDQLRQEIKSARVDLRTGGQTDVDEQFERISTEERTAADLYEETLSFRGGTRDGQPAARETVFDQVLGGEGHPPGKVELRIDRGWLPAFLEVGLEAVASVERVIGATHRIWVDQVLSAPEHEVFVRVFAPAGEVGVSDGVLVHLAPTVFDAVTATLSAEVDLLPEDFALGQPLLVEFVSDARRFDPLPTSNAYWAAATRSDLAVLKLLQSELDHMGANAVIEAQEAAVHSAESIGEGTADEVRRLAKQAPALAFVTPMLAPSKRQR